MGPPGPRSAASPMDKKRGKVVICVSGDSKIWAPSRFFELMTRWQQFGFQCRIRSVCLFIPEEKQRIRMGRRWDTKCKPVGEG